MLRHIFVHTPYKLRVFSALSGEAVSGSFDLMRWVIRAAQRSSMMSADPMPPSRCSPSMRSMQERLSMSAAR